jgi:hypothetical protein
MSELRNNKPEPTAVDDVRRVRENIARRHGGDIRKHIAETNRIAEKVRARLNVRLVPAPKIAPRRDGTQG